MECIVLAGGLGTRLRSVVNELPKCMAPVNGQPFLHYLFEYLKKQGITRVILSLGYKHEYVLDWISKQDLPFDIDPVIEEEPLGTGGGIQLALSKAKDSNIIVLNGDTIFTLSLNKLLSFHVEAKATTTLSLKEMYNFDRYGVVNLDEQNTIISFEEKQYREKGLINGGVYVMDKKAFANKDLPEKFSFEKDYLEQYISEKRFCGYISDGYFLDIGIPEDYHKAAEDFKSLF